MDYGVGDAVKAIREPGIDFITASNGSGPWIVREICECKNGLGVHLFGVQPPKNGFAWLASDFRKLDPATDYPELLTTSKPKEGVK